MDSIQNTSKKYLYGELNKEIEKSSYVGKSTDSLDIIVDNEEGTISGNVKVKAQLGETDDKAYPGNLGKRNYESILELLHDLNDEILRAKTSEHHLGEDIYTESQEREKQDNRLKFYIDELEKSVSSAIKVIEDSLEDTKSHQQVVDNEISTIKLDMSREVRQLEERISTERKRATASEDTIRDDVESTNEKIDEIHGELLTAISSLKSANTSIIDLISKERVSRLTTDGELGAKIDSNTESIEQVAKDSVSRDENLQEELNEHKKNYAQRSTDVDAILDSLKDTDVKLALTAYDNKVSLQNADKEIEKALTEETERATQREEELSSSIEHESDERKQSDSDINKRIDRETTKINESIDEIRDSLSNTSAGTGLQITDLKKADEELASKLEEEVSRATTAEISLTDDISEEASIRQSQIDDVSSKLVTLGTAIVEEKARASEEEDSIRELITLNSETLDAEIDALTSELTSADDSLRLSIETISDKLSKETARAQDEELSLSNSIVEISTKLTSDIEAEIDNRESQDSLIREELATGLSIERAFTNESISKVVSSVTELSSVVTTKADAKSVYSKDESYNREEIDSQFSVVNKSIEAIHVHDNKEILDSVTSQRVDSWDNAKNDAIIQSARYTDEEVAEVLQLAKEYADANDEDTKYDDSEIRELTANLDVVKADKSSVYTKSEVDNKFDSIDWAIKATHFHTNKPLLDTYTQSNEDIVDAVNKRHHHDNLGVISTITEEHITSWNNSTKVSNEYTDAEITKVLQAAKDYADANDEDTKYDDSEVRELIATLDSSKADKSSVYTKEETDATIKEVVDAIPEVDFTGYATEKWVEDKGYLTEHQPLDEYAKTSELKTKLSEFENDSQFITMEQVEDKGYSTFSGSYNDLTDKPLIPSTEGLATEQFVLDNIPKVDSFISEIPEEYITETELNEELEKRNYLTEHQDISGKADKVHTHSYNDLTDKPTIPTLDGYATEDWVNKQGYLKEIPSEYVTDDELTNKGYATSASLVDYAKKTDLPTVPTKVSDFENDVGYLTEHQDISGKADVSELNALGDRLNDLSVVVDGKASTTHTHSISEVTDYVAPDLSPYALSTDIPTNVSDLNNDAGYLTEHQSLEAYATTESVTNAINENNALIEDDIKEVETKLDNTKSELVQEIDALKSISLIIGGTAPVEE